MHRLKATHTRELLREGEQSQPPFSSTLPLTFTHTFTPICHSLFWELYNLFGNESQGYMVQFPSDGARIKNMVIHKIALFRPFPVPLSWIRIISVTLISIVFIILFVIYISPIKSIWARGDTVQNVWVAAVKLTRDMPELVLQIGNDILAASFPNKKELNFTELN